MKSAVFVAFAISSSATAFAYECNGSVNVGTTSSIQYKVTVLPKAQNQPLATGQVTVNVKSLQVGRVGGLPITTRWSELVTNDQGVQSGNLAKVFVVNFRAGTLALSIGNTRAALDGKLTLIAGKDVHAPVAVEVSCPIAR